MMGVEKMGDASTIVRFLLSSCSQANLNSVCCMRADFKAHQSPMSSKRGSALAHSRTAKGQFNCLQLVTELSRSCCSQSSETSNGRPGTSDGAADPPATPSLRIDVSEPVSAGLVRRTGAAGMGKGRQVCVL